MCKGVISWPVRGFLKFLIFAKWLLAKKRPKLGISLWFSGGLIHHPQTTKMAQPRSLPKINKFQL